MPYTLISIGKGLQLKGKNQPLPSNALPGDSNIMCIYSYVDTWPWRQEPRTTGPFLNHLLNESSSE